MLCENCKKETKKDKLKLIWKVAKLKTKPSHHGWSEIAYLNLDENYDEKDPLLFFYYDNLLNEVVLEDFKNSRKFVIIPGAKARAYGLASKIINNEKFDEKYLSDNMIKQLL